MTTTHETRARLSVGRGMFAVAAGVASGAALVLVPYALTRLVTAYSAPAIPYGWALTLAFPFVQGFALGVALGRKRYSGWTTAALVLMLALIQLICATVFLHEGVICLIILTPLLLPVMLGGAFAGRFAATRNASPTLHASLAPLIALAVFAETAGPRPSSESVVTDAITINAPAPYVWRYVLSYPENTAPPEYWLWRIGLPEPVQSVAEAPRVGAGRVCRFSGGAMFKERIVALTPNQSMTFAVTEQPDDPEVLGHFRFEQGQIRLQQNPDGSTTVIAASTYRLFVRPAAYFDLWTADITRHVHFRVLDHVKRLAERDYRAAHGVAPAS